MIIGFLYLHIPFKISVSKGRQRHSCHGMTASLPALVWMVIEFTKAEAVDLSRKIPIWRLCYCSSAVILAGCDQLGQAVNDAAERVTLSAVKTREKAGRSALWFKT
jgi:hypothetical protein